MEASSGLWSFIYYFMCMNITQWSVVIAQGPWLLYWGQWLLYWVGGYYIGSVVIVHGPWLLSGVRG